MTDGSARRGVPAPVERARTDLDKHDAGSLATVVIGYLLAGPLLYGGLGWLADRWLGTAYLTPVGVIAGMALSLFTIWLRYGKR